MMHLDMVEANTHYLNRSEPRPEGEDPSTSAVERIPLYEVYMRMAEDLAKRSNCIRARVGTVITDALLSNVLGIGYNGNASGLPNRCDSPEPGRATEAGAPLHL